MSTNEEFLQALQAEIGGSSYGTYPTELYEPIRYLMSLNGKRLRPLLTVIAASLFTDQWEKALRPAHALEMFHNFTLMHDDIMDKAPLRRGVPTVHTKWDENTAILSGDVMLVRAYGLFLETDPEVLPKVLARFTETAAEVCEGQQLDMNFEKRRDVTIGEYTEMIRLKTSVLLGFALELGGLIGGAGEDILPLLYEAGVNMGIGFQLKDDLLDVYGDPDKFGKLVGGDILANKKTFLFLKALEISSPSIREDLAALFFSAHADADEKVRKVVEIYDSLMIRSTTEALILSYFDKAITSIQQLPVPDEKKALLLRFAGDLIQREK